MHTLLTHPAFPLAVAVALIGWVAFIAYRPVIRRAPRVRPGDPLVLHGYGFGKPRPANRVVLVADGAALPLEIVEWANERVAARLPAGAASGGRVYVQKATPLGGWQSAPVPVVVQLEGLPSQPHGYEVPVAPDAPWPLFRRDHRNTGNSPIQAAYGGDTPWAFRTPKGIFSTPIMDGAGTIYVGSADHVYYALNPDGTERWRHATGEILDSAGALLRDDVHGDRPVLVMASGDGYMYCLRKDADVAASADRVQWSFDARVAPRASYNNWFEGNVAVGFDGTLYVGNTNFNYYAVAPDGTLKWTYETGANNWSMAAQADDGTVYWGSNDTFVRAVRPDGTERWRKRTLGLIAASAAVGSDGTVYIGSFDSYVYALDPESGAVNWKFKTNDHVYATAALGCDADGETTAIYVGSCDGTFYALAPDGRLLWSYDAGDPIRSSAAVGKAPAGEDGEIVYFGCGDGKLYALNARDGSRRWSFDTTAPEPELRDRNDLNGSVALGPTGVYVGGESGDFWYVPYDYPLHAPGDPRCATAPGADLPDDVTALYYVTPGGSTEPEPPAALSPATVITLRLVVRRDGRTVAARMRRRAPLSRRPALDVRLDPPAPFRTEVSADGRYVYIVPDGILEPDTDYTLHVRGAYFTGGRHIGNLTLGGARAGNYAGTFRFRTEPTGAACPFTAAEGQVSAFEWTRLALPIPTMMPSLNQIGFDYMDWIVGAVTAGAPDARGAGRAVLWAVGGRRDADGALRADPDTDFLLPLNVIYRGNAFVLTNRDFEMAVTGIPIPFTLVQMRGRFGDGLVADPGATIFCDTPALKIPTFGPLLVMAGLANDVWKRLIVTGTYVTRPYDVADGAHVRPAGVRVADVEYVPPTAREDGRVAARLACDAGVRYRRREHRPGIVLLDRAAGEAVYLSYLQNTTTVSNGTGNLEEIVLTLPAGTGLPAQLDAVVMADAFPLHRAQLT